MNNCGNCGATVNNNTDFCPSCGKKIEKKDVNENSNLHKNIKFSEQDLKDKFQEFNNTKDSTDEFDPADIQKNKNISILSYFFLLFLVPLLAVPESKFARFHANQGILLFIAGIIYNIPLTIFIAILENIPFIGWISFVFNILRAVPVIFMIIGIMNVSNGKAKELPFIGKYKVIN